MLQNFMYVSVWLKYVIMINNVLQQKHKKWQYSGKLSQTGLQGGAVVGTVSSQGVCSQILSSWQLGKAPAAAVPSVWTRKV